MTRIVFCSPQCMVCPRLASIALRLLQSILYKLFHRSPLAVHIEMLPSFVILGKLIFQLYLAERSFIKKVTLNSFHWITYHEEEESRIVVTVVCICVKHSCSTLRKQSFHWLTRIGTKHSQTEIYHSPGLSYVNITYSFPRCNGIFNLSKLFTLRRPPWQTRVDPYLLVR